MTKQSSIFKKYDPLVEFERYTADEIAELPQAEMERYFLAKCPGFNIVFLKDDDGNDWYDWLKSLSDKNLKVSYNPDTKEIIHFSYDASAIFPINQVVQEIAPEDVPIEFLDAGENALGGAFILEGGKITPAQVDVFEVALHKKMELLSQASNVISLLQDAIELDMATEEEVSSLDEWRKYRVLLNRVNPNEPDWPLKPTQ
ncbi:tail fiber assembly protein [Enterobacter cloacae]